MPGGMAGSRRCGNKKIRREAEVICSPHASLETSMEGRSTALRLSAQADQMEDLLENSPASNAKALRASCARRRNRNSSRNADVSHPAEDHATSFGVPFHTCTRRKSDREIQPAQHPDAHTDEADLSCSASSGKTEALEGRHRSAWSKDRRSRPPNGRRGSMSIGRQGIRDMAAVDGDPQPVPLASLDRLATDCLSKRGFDELEGIGCPPGH